MADKPFSRLEQDLRIYGHFRDYVKHEDGLVNHRLTWILNIHGFLYATYGFTIQKKLEVAAYLSVNIKNPDDYVMAMSGLRFGLSYSIADVYLFLIFISIIGGIISYYGYRSIRAAHRASDGLRNIFEKNFPQYVPPDDGIVDDQPKNSIKGLNLFELGDDFRTVHMPSIGGAGRARISKLGSSASLTIPIILLIGWIMALLYTLFELSHVSVSILAPLSHLLSDIFP